MSSFNKLLKRNCKLFFKDKAMFFTSIITPIILLVLYGTFLADIYRDSFRLSIPKGIEISERLINGAVGGQLFSSLLAVSCVTVSFCCNMLMVQDKVSGAAADFAVSPVKRYITALGYYTATFISTLIVCLVATAACFVYISQVGWYISASDVLFILLDTVLLVLFGTSLSSLINFFLKSQGQISAVGTIVSSGYGFICGAYMPISNFSETLQRVVSFLPSTYGTSLIRNHTMQGAFAEMSAEGVPSEVIDGIKTGIDCNLSFYDHSVGLGTMYAIVGGFTVLVVAAYVALNVFVNKKEK